MFAQLHAQFILLNVLTIIIVFKRYQVIIIYILFDTESKLPG